MPPRNRRNVGLAKGFRSGLEDVVASHIEEVTGAAADYESFKIEYVKPARKSRYTPDFKLPNGIIIETKGRFEVADRQKHILVKEQHPHLDIRFVFSSSTARIRKGSPTTYADWCRKHGFKFADKRIPQDWFNEPLHKTKKD